MKKLNVSNLAQLVQYAMVYRIIDFPRMRSAGDE
jgi:hypothetical protein